VRRTPPASHPKSDSRRKAWPLGSGDSDTHHKETGKGLDALERLRPALIKSATSRGADEELERSYILNYDEAITKGPRR